MGYSEGNLVGWLTAFVCIFGREEGDIHISLIGTLRLVILKLLEEVPSWSTNIAISVGSHFECQPLR